eukprot:scaffold15218_cov42-Phaeocystis_antarctica.AAC.1
MASLSGVTRLSSIVVRIFLPLWRCRRVFFGVVAGCFFGDVAALQEAATPPKEFVEATSLPHQSDPRELRHASAFNLPPPPRSTEHLLRAALLVLNLRRAPPCRRRHR